MNNMHFCLNDRQMEELEEWREKVKDLHGDIGNEEFRFEPCGIGTNIIVKNKTYDIEIDLTDVGEW